MPDKALGLRLGSPHHHAYVVEDIAATVERLLTGVGAGPFFLAERVPLEDVRSRDEPAMFDHNSAFGCCGEAVIELIEPARLAPRRVQERFTGPRPRVHHVAYVLGERAVGELRSELDERGIREYLSSRLGPLESTLHDASALFGHDIEMHADVEALHQFFAMVRGAADEWDGTEPLRPAPS